MSFSGSLNNAMSGLNVAARMANLVSSNVANAMTEGYGRRELELTPLKGGGVQIASQRRMVDVALLNDRRLSEASFAFADRSAGFMRSLETSIGLPNEPGSLTDVMVQFENRLIEATGDPSSTQRLTGVADAARAMVSKISAISKDIQSMRMEADAAIATDVETLNTAVAQVAELNFQIQRSSVAQQPISALQDQRQQLIDQIGEIIPVREVARENGAVALMTLGGLQLLDGTAAEISFTPTPILTPDMDVSSGTVNQITVNGRTVDMDDAKIAGGRLSAHLAIRDHDGPNEQRKLDDLALDLINRFQDPTIDPTLNAGAAGLFTDAGQPIDLSDITGVSQRLSLNALVDPLNGGSVIKLRDGLGATSAGSSGDATRLNAYLDALRSQSAPVQSNLSGRAQSFASFGSEFLASVTGQRFTSESEMTFLSTKAESLRSLERQQGVDTDQEMQKLLLIEQAYAANAKVIQTIDEMIDELMRI
ncbi:flagellar hook-associated protein FlgK [Nereida sp. MMG025]|uniref:flagellar hook-associated protein FlgK n=1 Tax=Nereida sp. MMG025 TaxID=2909981 RepID=UPI002102163F|nr:flagellar hook-associated protein FlgK [Nereida sp. MMG025]MCF6444659.1 flagellar hook-associated protein FlgK [Nereida sp. MMG025]